MASRISIRPPRALRLARPGSLGTLSLALSNGGANIIEVGAHSTSDGIAVDIFKIAAHNEVSPVDEQELAGLDALNPMRPILSTRSLLLQWFLSSIRSFAACGGPRASFPPLLARTPVTLSAATRISIDVRVFFTPFCAKGWAPSPRYANQAFPIPDPNQRAAHRLYSTVVTYRWHCRTVCGWACPCDFHPAGGAHRRLACRRRFRRRCQNTNHGFDSDLAAAMLATHFIR